MCSRIVLILEVSFLFVGLGFLHIFMLPQASVRCWQQPFSWTGSQRTKLCFGSTFSCATRRMRELFSCQIPTLIHNHTWHTYLCLLLPQSFGFVTYTYIYFFSSAPFMGVTAGEASGVHFLFTNGFSNLRSNGASSVSELLMFSHQIRQSPNSYRTLLLMSFYALKVLACLRLKKKNPCFFISYMWYQTGGRGSASSHEAWAFLCELNVGFFLL